MSESDAAVLFERYHLSIFRYVRRMTRRDDVAEDLTQEVFVRVVRGQERYEARGRDAAWLFRIARNLLVDYRRQAARRPEPTGDVEQAARPARQPLATDLHEALGQLAETDRDVFLLREMGGLSYQEIARVCGVTPDGVRSRIHRARKSLRTALAPSHHPFENGRRGDPR